jgi:hypothetical protein
MHVRLADLEADAPAIMAGARDFLSRIDFAEWMPDEEGELAAAVGRILALDGVEVALAVDDEAIVGGLGVIYAPYIWNPNMTMAEELFFWTPRDAPYGAALRLVRFVRCRAAEKQAAMVIFKALRTSPPSLAKLYRALGLRCLEATYMGTI